MVSITKDHFSIRQICESGQCFRLERLDGEEDIYKLTALGRYLEIRQRGNEIAFDCPPQEFDRIWKDYFDLDTDYGRFIHSIDREDAYLLEAARQGSGIRILRQDLWEIIISFLSPSRIISNASGSASICSAKTTGRRSRRKRDRFIMVSPARRRSPKYLWKIYMPVTWDTEAVIFTKRPSAWRRERWI